MKIRRKTVRVLSSILIFLVLWVLGRFFTDGSYEEEYSQNEDALIAEYLKKEKEKENEDEDETKSEETPIEEIQEKTKENQSRQNNNTGEKKNKNTAQKQSPSSKNETGSTERPQNNADNAPSDQKKDNTPEKKNNQQNSSQNDYTREVVRLCNNYRQEAGIAILSNQNSKLQQAANIRCEEIKQNFSHTRPNGTSAYTVLSEAGISYNTWGENIAYGQKTPAQAVNVWMNSPGHRANILNKNFKQIAVGMKDNYWVQIFI